MSVAAVQWAEKQTLPPSHALLLRTLAWTINRRGNGWLSRDKMAARSNGISLATVGRALRDLRRIGALSHCWAIEGGRKRKCYRLDIRRIVIWDRKECSWVQYVRRLQGQITAAQLLPGETREAFVVRQTARLLKVSRQ